MTEQELDRAIADVLGREYTIADDAIVLYSKSFGEMNLAGYSNLRDALSHLRIAFDAGLSLQFRTEQLICAREHVRRATTEAYQELFERIYATASKAYALYVEECLPLEAMLGYKGTIDHRGICAEFKQLRNELKECRRGKAITEPGSVKQLIEACEAVCNLKSRVVKFKAIFLRNGGDKYTLPSF